MQEFIDIIAINNERDCNIVGFQSGLGFFILIEKLRHKHWKFIVDIKYHHVDNFFQDSIVLFSLEFFVLFFKTNILFSCDFGPDFVRLWSELGFEGFTELGQFFVLLFKEEALDV